MHGEVTDRRQQEGRVVIERPQSNVALVAQQSTDLHLPVSGGGVGGGVVVIDVQRHILHTGLQWGFAADGADPVLSRQHPLVLVQGQPVKKHQVRGFMFPLQFVGSIPLNFRNIFRKRYELGFVGRLFHLLQPLAIHTRRMFRASRLVRSHLASGERLSAERAGPKHPTARAKIFRNFTGPVYRQPIPASLFVTGDTGMIPAMLHSASFWEVIDGSNLLARSANLLLGRHARSFGTISAEVPVHLASDNRFTTPCTGNDSLSAHRFSRLHVSRTARRIASASFTCQRSAKSSRVFRSSLERSRCNCNSLGGICSHSRPNRYPLSIGEKENLHETFRGLLPQAGVRMTQTEGGAQ